MHTSEISTQQVTHSKLSLKAFVFQTATQWENESSRRPSKTQKNQKIITFYHSLPEKNQRLLEINKLFNEDYSCDVLYTLINFMITWFLKKNYLLNTWHLRVLKSMRFFKHFTWLASWTSIIQTLINQISQLPGDLVLWSQFLMTITKS